MFPSSPKKSPILTRLKSSGSESADPDGGEDTVDAQDALFYSINDRQVANIQLEFFYKPHTITLLTFTFIPIIYFAFTRDTEESLANNVWAGVKFIIFLSLVISTLAFPNGPFTRPHPLIWRMVFGLSVLYLMALVFILFQNYDTVKYMLEWVFPDLEGFTIDSEREYGINCSDVSIERIWSHLDVFALGHFFGWTLKAMLIRHYGVSWLISVTWEITEMAFSHLLPNFIECWWDAFILDVLICNGAGIWLGMYICRKLEMRKYQWESIKNITSTKGKIKRAVLQFTPETWTSMKWLDPSCTYVRYLAVTQLVIYWQITELNTFFLKHIFEIPPGHPLSIGRLAMIALIVAPSLRQYYVYVVDARCKRVGSQCWVFGAIMFLELIICIRFGLDLFAQTQIRNIVIWIIIQLIQVIARPTPESSTDSTLNERSLASDAATYLLVPAAVVLGTEGAILGATGTTFGDSIQSIGDGIKFIGDEVKDVGVGFTNISRGLKGVSGIMYQWGTGGSLVPVIGRDSDLTDTLEVLSKFSPDFSRQVLDFYFHNLNQNDLDYHDDPGDQDYPIDSTDSTPTN